MTERNRPDPDELLRILKVENGTEPGNGELKIFLGYAAGVGKTYTMLGEARLVRDKGCDAVIGLVETHGRRETEALTADFEIIPRLKIPHGGFIIDEMDLEGIVGRHPRLVLVDELAHSNAPGLKNSKRYEDVEDLLKAGISVYTTLNIQHVESTVDVVRQVSGVRVSETVPDRILQMAAQIELVDLTPEDLLVRLAEGKVYVPPKARLAMSRFFRKGNLLALRELALRYAARRVDADMRSYMDTHTMTGPFPVGSRIAVCLSTAKTSERLVRIGRRMSEELEADWFAVYVESPEEVGISDESRNRLRRHMQLAEELGASPAYLTGPHIAEEILRFAHSRHLTLLIIGLPLRSRWQQWIHGTVVDEILRSSGPIHVLVVGGQDAPQTSQRSPKRHQDRKWYPHILDVGAICIALALCLPLRFRLDPVGISMLLLAPVVAIGMTRGIRSSLWAILFALAGLDFFFIDPILSFKLADSEYAVVLGVFVFVALVTSSIAEVVRWEWAKTRHQQRFLSSLYSFSRDMMSAATSTDLLYRATETIADVFECEAVILESDEQDRLQVRARTGLEVPFGDHEIGVASWVFQHERPAGRGTDTLSSVAWHCLPLKGRIGTVGVLAVSKPAPGRFLSNEQMRLLASLANLLALAMGRTERAGRPVRPAEKV